MEDCLFCKIVSGKVPSTKVFEDDDILAFNDINPMAPVHVLIIPKKHIVNLLAATKDDNYLWGKIVASSIEIANKLGLSKGYKLEVNNGKDAGQVVFHTHFHLLGGWEK